LTGMWEAIRAQEGDLGSMYWQNPPWCVWEPGVPDPSTGGYAVITDPTWGIWNAAISTPEWILHTFGSGDTITLHPRLGDVTNPGVGINPTQSPTDPYGLVAYGTIEVSSALYDVFERGMADSSTGSALMAALASADAFQIANGGQASLTPQIQPIVDDINKIKDVADGVHAFLDLVSMYPLIGGLADLINGFVYFLEADRLNAWLCLASVLLPSALGLAVAVPRWVRRARVVTDVVDDTRMTFRAVQKTADLSADEVASIAVQVRAHTEIELHDNVINVYRRLDEKGPMSNRERKAWLYQELTPAFTTVYNPRTGEYSTALNNPKGYLPDDLDPRLKERIDNMPMDIKSTVTEVNGGVGSHSEIYAINEALQKDPNANIEDLLVDTRRTGLDPKQEKGKNFPACAHCRWIIDGAIIISES